jgi:LPXTG-motif cell wall-anchored protein
MGKKSRRSFFLCFLCFLIALPISGFANTATTETSIEPQEINNQLTNPDLSQLKSPSPDLGNKPEDNAENPDPASNLDLMEEPLPEEGIATNDPFFSNETGKDSEGLKENVNSIENSSPVTNNDANKESIIESEKTSDPQNAIMKEDNSNLELTKVRKGNGKVPKNEIMSFSTLSDGLSTENLNTEDITPLKLVQTLLGEGVEIQNVSFSGADVAAGLFSGGNGIIGFEQGIILSTGAIANVIGPNTDDGISTTNGLGDDPDLKSLIPDNEVNDAAVLEFDFIPTFDTLKFKYVFSSEEYNEYVNSEYNDVFGFFVNGKNMALIPGTEIPVSINNINGGNPFGENATNPQYFINNDLDDGGGSINTEMDGLTTVLTVQAPVIKGEPNHIKMAIGDAGDSDYDSAVFIESGSFTSVDATPPEKPTVNQVGDGDTQVTGKAEPKATVFVKAGDVEIGKAASDDSGSFTVNIPKQDAGTVLNVFAQDAAENISEPETLTVIDETPPANPIVNSVTNMDASVTGQSEADAKIEVKVDNKVIGSAIAGADGKFSVSIPKQEVNTVLEVTATDKAGHISLATKVIVTLKTTSTAINVKTPVTTGATELPNTATNTYNFLFAGLALIVIGGSSFVFRRRKA